MRRKHKQTTPENGTVNVRVVSGNRGRVPTSVVIGTGIAGGMLASTLAVLSFFDRGAGVKVDEEVQTTQASITEIAPVNFDCRARTKTRIKNRVSMNKSLLGVDLAADVKVKTDARIQTFTCVTGKNVRVVANAQTGGQTVYVPTSNVRMFSELNEAETRSVVDRDAVSEIGKGILGVVEAVTPINGPNKGLEESAAFMTQVGRAAAVNTAEVNCATAAWGVMPEVINRGYDLAAVAQGLDPEDITVVFEGPTPAFVDKYSLPKGYEIKTTAEGECELLDGAYVPAIQPMPQTSSPERAA